MTDEAYATAIAAQVEKINELIRGAHCAGLRVDVHARGLPTLITDSPWEDKKEVVVRVYRRLG